MLTIVVSMLGILAIAGLVVTFVAYPHRGQEVPQVPWLGEAMNRAVERAPMIRVEDDAPAGRQ